MTFRIILTVLWCIEAFSVLIRIDEPREPTKVGEALIVVIISGVLIYGLWNWL